MKNQNNPKQKRILLHVGLHKTASTYIQQILGQSNQSLRKQGWNFPIYSDGQKNDLTNHSNLLYTLFAENTDSYVPNIQSKSNNQELFNIFENTLKSELQSDFNLILSGEDVSALSEASLHKLAKVLEPYELTVIAFVRESYSYLCSNLQHRIHRGAHGLKVEVPSLSKNCIRLKEAFPDIKFYSYEKVKAEKNGFMNVFSELCEISIKPINKRIFANVSLGNKTIRFLAEFNQYYPLIGEDNQLNPHRPSFNVKKIDFDPNKFLLTKSEYLTIEKQIRQENNRLRTCTKLSMIRTVRPIPFADESELTWNEALKLLTKTSTMPNALAHIAFIYVLKQQVGQKAFKYFRPYLNFALIKYNIFKRVKNLLPKRQLR